MTTTDQQTGMKPYVVHTVGDASETIQTPGMVRQPAIVPGKGDTRKIWMGKVTAAPREKGPPHTHLEAETAAYVLKGHVRVTLAKLRGVDEAAATHLRRRPTPRTSRRTLRRGKEGTCAARRKPVVNLSRCRCATVGANVYSPHFCVRGIHRFTAPQYGE